MKMIHGCEVLHNMFVKFCYSIRYVLMSYVYNIVYDNIQCMCVRFAKQNM